MPRARPRPILRFGALLLAAAAGFSCSDSTGPRAGARIQVTVGGLPAAGPASVEIEGPGYTRVIAGSATIAVAPGSYTITAADVQQYGVGFRPQQSRQVLTVGRGQTAQVMVRYTLPMTTLENDVPHVTGRTESAPVGGTFDYHRVAVPQGTLRLTVTVTGTEGGPELYLRHRSVPTVADFDCRASSRGAPDYSCTVAAPAAGDWIILLHGSRPYSNVTLRATLVVGGVLALHVHGLPGGTAARIAVSGPTGHRTDVSGSAALEALTPGPYAILASPVTHGDVTFVPRPAAQHVMVGGGARHDVAIDYIPSAGGTNLGIAAMHITQAIQTLSGAVPLIAGRDGLLRIFVRGTGPGPMRTPVRVRLYQHEQLLETHIIPAPPAGVPEHVDESELSSSFNLRLPGSVIRPGLSVLADVDPAGEVAEADETDNVYPATGVPLAPEVRVAPAHRARLVPVIQAPSGLAGDVHPGNADGYVTLAQATYPLPGTIDVDVRAPYTFSGAVSSAYDSTWSRLLSEISLLRLADGSTRHYFGVFRPAYASGGTGLGYIGQPAAISVDWPGLRSYIVAHEWGHNFGRLHVDCGYATPNPDPAYPYPAGRPNADGWDGRTGTMRAAASHYDVLSYCQPGWVSDYTYNAVMAFRAMHTALPAAGPGGSAKQLVLLIWGRIAGDQVTLEPAFEVESVPVLPARSGGLQVQATDDSGAVLFELRFDGDEIDHLEGVRHFAFAVPLDLLRGRTPSLLRLRGGGRESVRAAAHVGGAQADVRVSRQDGRVRIQWDATRHAAVLVRDARTGDVLALARGGEIQIESSAPELEVHVSDGVRSMARKVPVPH